MIKKLLIANRGEIAVRVIRAARELGIRTVAVYSDADAHAVHTSLADEAVWIGESAPGASYLRIDAILDAARSSGADAIHPGYGFLSERGEFSQACADAGLIFVGPPAKAMRALGSKIDAKTLAVASEVPITPGFFEPGASPTELRAAAEQIGFPVLLKASAGGGGRGMRVVREAAEFDHELSVASSEALQAFGDGTMMVEKLVERPRHVEVQFLADAHGQVACLFERECSLQRRHQKLIEEAPATFSKDQSSRWDGMAALWPAMQRATKRLAMAAGYIGAGTAEYLVDGATGAFYFLEVNARLQVEHPVTEAITGIDLVKWQLRVASGERLLLGEDLMEGDRRAIRGHSIEARVVAEDPAKGFLPSTGRILAWALPTAPGVRVDTGFGPGSEISRFYDSLIAKVIVAAETREEAIDRLAAALRDFHVLGVKTNIPFLLDLLADAKFRDSEHDTGYLGREYDDWEPPDAIPPELGLLMRQGTGTATVTGAAPKAPLVWDLSDEFRVVR
ncbi:MAG: Acetyl-/propionyl-coenzyme A carboxylase alpha chain [Fimbriimonadaceae bacterium]|nr:Acetyl-/propionyl-coenzyme A carboxylase alpha chain [Fimbriimonadaceae bacterium]